jgi:UDP-N-acetylmuramyl tripeptide synthase
MRIELDEVRRLTGPNLLWDKPGAIVDVFIETIDPTKVVLMWQKHMDVMLQHFGWQDQSHTFRLYTGGASFALSAPMDALYVACDLAELAWDCCVAEILGQPALDVATHIKDLQAALTIERNPQLLALLASAAQHNVTCLADDDEISLGMGGTVKTWSVATLPEITGQDWQDFRDIPCAFVTGTNGKSTSVRLAAHMAKAAGLNAGVTSTDFIKVGDDIIDHGDYSGPGGARMLLRDPRTEIAFLEVARGGILRRGLPISKVDAALVTNVASDHLGQYGINTVEELAQAKFVVAKGLSDTGVLVVNADNELTRQQGLNSQKTLCWFSQDEQHPLIQQQLKDQARAVFVKDGMLVYSHEGQQVELIQVNKIPMTFNGTASHNIENALGVVGLCKALALPNAAIVQGLLEFSSNAQDNPGRGNVYQRNGAQIIVDFAHNQHSMQAIVNMVKSMPAKRRLVMFGHAGDRTDKDIQDLTLAVKELQADCYLVSEIEKYLRGRELGDISTLVKEYLLSLGVDGNHIHSAASPFEGMQYLLEQAREGDVVLLFVLDQRDEIHRWLSAE